MNHAFPTPRIGSAFTAAAVVTLGTFAASTAHAQLPEPNVTFSMVGENDGFAENDINSVAFSRSNLVTSGDYQFIAYYDRDSGFFDSETLHIGRRLHGTDSWSVVDTGLEAVNINDSHDNVNLAVDGNGRLHVAWGVHNDPIRYRISDTSVLGASFNASMLALSEHSHWSNPTAVNANDVTYPEFYPIPNGDGDLLFTFRDGGNGGGSGNGNSWFARYDAQTNTFEQNLVVNGIEDSVNAYFNRLVYDSEGTLHASWTWRDTPDFQTNHDLLYAQSSDNGQTWTTQDGTPYSLPITRGAAQVIADIPQGSSLINQADMTVDANDHPLIATWYMPDGEDEREYMLHYFDGEDWQASQITDRSGNGSDIRLLARPLVLSDDENRTLVVMRYDQGSNNGITVAVSEDNENWDFITLSDEDLGIYEPSYDAVLWERENKLHLYYQQLGYDDESDVMVLEWDAKAYFAAIPEPGSAAMLVGAMGTLALRRHRRTRA